MSVKNITYCTTIPSLSYVRRSPCPSLSSDLAKTSPHVLVPERFALHLGTHLVSKYAHLNKAFITIEQLRWQRIPIAQGAGQTPKPHSHSFYRDGDEKRVVEVEVRAYALTASRIQPLTS